MPRKTNKRCKVIEAEAYRYAVHFFWTNSAGGRLTEEPFWMIGNLGVGLDVVDLLRELGHVVEVIDLVDEEE